MKRKLWIVLAAALLAGLIYCANAQADGPSGWSGNLTWFISGDTLTVRGCGAIPDYGNPLSGTSNRPTWYTYRDSFHKVVIQEGVTQVGTWAFAYCGVDEVRLPGTMLRLKSNSFVNSSYLTVYYRGSEHDYEDVIKDDIGASIWDVYCRAGVVDEFMSWRVHDDGELSVSMNTLVAWDMPGFGFYNAQPWRGYADDITHITIDGPFKSIHNYAFQNLNHVAFVEFTRIDCLENIGWYAFDGCTALNTVYIDGTQAKWNSVTMESGNRPLQSAEVRFLQGSGGSDVLWHLNEGTLTIYGSGAMTNWGNMGAAPWASMGGTVERIVVGDHVTSIGAYAFTTCVSCLRVDLPAGLTSVGQSAFSNMTSLEKVYYNGTEEEWSHVTKGSDNAPLSAHLVPLKGTCGTYAYWTIADNTLKITGSGYMRDFQSSSDQPWRGATELFYKVEIDGPTLIGAYAFAELKTIKVVNLRSTVTRIRYNAFEGCSALREVQMSSALTRVEGEAFLDCENLESMYLPDAASIANTAFQNCPKYEFFVTFLLNGHGSDQPNVQRVYRWKKVVEPTPPTAADWVFTGWYLNAACTQPYDMNAGVTSDLNLYAGWSMDSCAVTFAANGGTGHMTTVYVLRGRTFTLPDNGFTAPAGKAFYGWTVGSSSIMRDPGYTFTVSNDVTITANWYGPFIVSFSPGEGSGSMASIQVVPGTRFVLPECEFTGPLGAAFAGWRNVTTIYQPGLDLYIQTSTSFTAVWKGPFTVTYDANGGTGNMYPDSVGYGETLTLPQCDYTPPAGKKFANYHVTGENLDADLWAGYKLTVYSDVTVTPQWTTAQVRFTANGGTGFISPAWMTPDSNGCITLPECSLTPPDGKMFYMWSVFAHPGDTVPIYGDTTIYPLWVIAQYSVSYDADGGTGSMSPFTTWGDSFELPDCAFTPPAGKQFYCWSVPTAVTNYKHYYPGEWVKASGDTVVQAYWIKATPTTCAVTFAHEGGSGSMAGITVPYNEPFALPACDYTPLSGEVFDHWRLNDTDGGYLVGRYNEGDTVTLTEDVTATACFRSLYTYTVTFNSWYHSALPADQTVTEGQCIADPGPLPAPGYTFNGWTFTYTVYDGDDYTWETIPVDFSQPVDYYAALDQISPGGEIRIRADCTQRLYTVSLSVSDGGTAWINNPQESYQYGNGIYLGYEAEDGCYLVSMTLVPEEGESCEVWPPEFNQPNFTVPDCNVTVEVVFHRPQVISGQCGNDLYWTLTDGLLTISGVGDMPDFDSASDTPWADYMEDITLLSVEEGVTGIGDRAFVRAANMYWANLPSTVTRIGELAFYECQSLNAVGLAEGLTVIEGNAFALTALYSVNIPGSVTRIGESAFEGCEDLHYVILNEGLQHIGSFAFGSCPAIEQIELPESVISVGSYAFDSCSALVTVTGLEHVSQVYSGLFNECVSLTDVTLPPMSVIPGDLLARCSSLHRINIPGTVTEIEDWAFDDCDSLAVIDYDGTLAMWQAIDIGAYNDALLNADLNHIYALSFVTWGDPALEPVLFQAGEIPAQPDDPVKMGALFLAWYLDADMTEEYAFDETLSADTTLYAAYFYPDVYHALRLPAALTSVRSKAFSGVPVSTVVVPAGVTSIAFNALPEATCYVLGFPGSAAETWALMHEGMTFIPIDAAWLASH